MGSARFRLNGHTNSGEFFCFILCNPAPVKYEYELISVVISVDLHGSNIATAGGDMCCRICKSVLFHKGD